jgi:hypothetical protein
VTKATVIGCLVNPITGAFDRCASGIPDQSFSGWS